MLVNGKQYRTVWMEGKTVRMIDQILIPHRFEILDLNEYTDTARAIKDMHIRGAGAIGGAAGYAIAQAALTAPSDDKKGFLAYVEKAAEVVRNTRPTAQDLFYAVNRVVSAVKKSFDDGSVETARKASVDEAQAIADEDAEAGRKIGEHGEKLIKDGCRILTHCNAGWLAFVDWGSALAPIYVAKRKGKKVFVYADETRPRCQGARLTAWELAGEGVDHVIIADNAAGYYMKKGEIDMVIVGSDRIAANGDVANKIGTYEKAVLAKENNIPFYVAAPTSTIDRDCVSGDKIPIEERSEDEVLYMFGRTDDGKITKVRMSPKESHAKNPSFDVTPAKYVKGIITEKGIVEASEKGIKGLFE